MEVAPHLSALPLQAFYRDLIKLTARIQRNLLHISREFLIQQAASPPLAHTNTPPEGGPPPSEGGWRIAPLPHFDADPRLPVCSPGQGYSKQQIDSRLQSLEDAKQSLESTVQEAILSQEAIFPGKRDATQGRLRSLGVSLDEFIQCRGRLPGPYQQLRAVWVAALRGGEPVFPIL